MTPWPSRQNHEFEQHLLSETPGQTVPQTVQPAIQQDVQQHVQQPAIPLALTRLQRSWRDPTRPVTFRLPDSLYETLLRKAHYNGFTQTGILVEALRFYLDQLPGPPEGWRSERRDGPSASFVRIPAISLDKTDVLG
jgi:hypothetical protein